MHRRCEERFWTTEALLQLILLSQRYAAVQIKEKERGKAWRRYILVEQRDRFPGIMAESTLLGDEDLVLPCGARPS